MNLDYISLFYDLQKEAKIVNTIWEVNEWKIKKCTCLGPKF
jgi:hypothetical protein